MVVVGNLTVGGTGKTPLALWLAQALRAQGRTVGIVSRGYGRADGSRAAGERHMPTGARLAMSRCCWRGAAAAPPWWRRIARPAPRHSIAQGAQVVVADDGLQHLRLARDCEIVVVDGARGFGNGRVLPAGPLREPLAQLACADLIVVNGARRSTPRWPHCPPRGP